MSAQLVLSVRFLDPLPCFHGRGDGGEPEWPPSPLRVFQSLVNAAARRCVDSTERMVALTALRSLEQRAPTVVAPPTHPESTTHRLYVPNNATDLVTARWARGVDEAGIAEFRTEKDVRPTRLHGDTVRYLYPLADGDRHHVDTLRAIARAVTHLGWGVDMVAADVELLTHEEAARLPGERWNAAANGGAPLRAPIAGTLDDLLRKHEAFLGRLQGDGFNPVPPLTAFRVVGYRRATDFEGRAWCAFGVLKPDASGFRPFDTPRRARDVAGMARNLMACAARRQGWSDDEINVFVHGKTFDGAAPASGKTSPDRFAYLPLPTINRVLNNRVESIRRVLVAAPSHCSDKIEWARRVLAGQDLIATDGAVAALLNILPSNDWVLKQYTRASRVWTTVTPVILPGHDDRSPEKARSLLRKAFAQAGVGHELLADAELDFRGVGFLPGCELAARYLPPDNLDRRPRYHVRVRFAAPLRGPLAVGAGRFRAMGLFVAADA